MLGLGLHFLPAASPSADSFDRFFNALVLVSFLAFVLVVGAGAVFVWKYRRRKEGETTPYIPHNFAVEFFSVFVTSVVVAVIFLWGWFDWVKYYEPNAPYEYEINVLGQQWSWQIQYTDGKNLVNEMYVPRGVPVKLIMSSKDVLHSFYVPAFRIKMDTVPGQYTVLRFTASRSGTYDIFCTEYCGASHSAMIGKIHVLEPEDFEKWKAGIYKAPVLASVEGAKGEAKPELSLADKGKVLYQTKTCNTCHTINGASLIGPSFKGIFGATHELVDGSKVVVDENYIRESIMDPMKKIAKGYPPAMPTFRGMVSEEEMNALIAYIKTLK